MSVEVPQETIMRPYRNLAAAVLARAVKDIADRKTSMTKRGQAQRFLTGELEPSTLRLWCTLLHVSPDYLRKRIKSGSVEELTDQFCEHIKNNQRGSVEA